jgi:hypothetical protein
MFRVLTDEYRVESEYDDVVVGTIYEPAETPGLWSWK